RFRWTAKLYPQIPVRYIEIWILEREKTWKSTGMCHTILSISKIREINITQISFVQIFFKHTTILLADKNALSFVEAPDLIYRRFYRKDLTHKFPKTRIYSKNYLI